MSTIPVVVDDGQRLDLRPVQSRVAQHLVVRTELGLGPAERQKLWGWRDTLLHLGDRGITRVDRPGTTADAMSLFAASAIGPIVVAHDGSLHRWTEHGLEAMGWSVPGKPRQVVVLGLDAHTLVRDFGPRHTELRVTATGVPTWRREGVALTVLPVGGRLIGGELHDLTCLTALQVDDGTVCWRAQFDVRVDHLIAAVGDTVWVALEDGRMLALDASTGNVRASVSHHAVRGWERGPVTEAGRLVLLRSTALTMIDLVRAEVSHFPLPGRREAPAFVRVTLDGHVVFTDGYRCVSLLVVPDHEIRLVYTADAMITGLEIHAGAVYVLTETGRLTTLG